MPPFINGQGGRFSLLNLPFLMPEQNMHEPSSTLGRQRWVPVMIPSSPIGLPYHPVRPSACPTWLTIWITGSHKRHPMPALQYLRCQSIGPHGFSTIEVQRGYRSYANWNKSQSHIHTMIQVPPSLSFFDGTQSTLFHGIQSTYNLRTWYNVRMKPVVSPFLLQESTSRVACYWGLLSLNPESLPTYPCPHHSFQ